MELKKVIVIYKKTVRLSNERVDCENLADATQTKRQAQHEEALELVHRELNSLGLCVELMDRDDFQGQSADLILTVGGDGTFLAAAHFAKGMPILGFNSMPGHSVGFFLATTAKNFKKKLDDICKGRWQPTELPLMECFLDDKRILPPAVNDILFAAASPAEMSRYRLSAGQRTEAQRSSGVWIAAGPGSTAGIRSAGGREQLLTSRQLQLVVREPFFLPGKKYELTRLVLKEGQNVSLIPEMKKAFAYVDGPKFCQVISYGETLSVRVADETLRVFL